MLLSSFPNYYFRSVTLALAGLSGSSPRTPPRKSAGTLEIFCKPSGVAVEAISVVRVASLRAEFPLLTDSIEWNMFSRHGMWLVSRLGPIQS